MFLTCGIEGNAQYIVSGDRHVLNVKKHGSIEIVTLDEFVKLLSYTET